VVSWNSRTSGLMHIASRRRRTIVAAVGVKADIRRRLAPMAGIGQFAVIQSVAPALRVEVSPVDIRNAGEIERAVTEFARSVNGGLILTSSALANVHRDLIIRLAPNSGCPQSTRSASSRAPAVSPPTGRIRSIRTGSRPATSIASSRARSQQTFRCCSRRSSTSSSTSRPPRRLASTFRRRCLLAPMR